MDIYKLEYFLTTAQMENMTKAAKALNVTQPTLSVAITKMEQELGHPLFYRVGRHILLSEYGKVLFQHAKVILDEWNNVKYEMEALEERRGQIIHLGVTGSNYIKRIMLECSEQFQDLFFDQRELHREDLSNPFAYSLLDFVFTTSPIEDPQWVNEPLFKERILVGVSLRHPLAKDDRISLSELGAERFVMLSKHSVSTMQFENMFQKAGIRPQIVKEPLRDQIVEMVARNIGIGLFGENFVLPPHGDLSGICFLHLTDDFCERTIYFAYKKATKYEGDSEKFRQKVLSYKVL